MFVNFNNYGVNVGAIYWTLEKLVKVSKYDIDEYVRKIKSKYSFPKCNFHKYVL